MELPLFLRGLDDAFFYLVSNSLGGKRLQLAAVNMPSVPEGFECRLFDLNPERVERSLGAEYWLRQGSCVDDIERLPSGEIRLSSDLELPDEANWVTILLNKERPGRWCRFFFQSASYDENAVREMLQTRFDDPTLQWFGASAYF